VTGFYPHHAVLHRLSIRPSVTSRHSTKTASPGTLVSGAKDSAKFRECHLQGGAK